MITAVIVALSLYGFCVAWLYKNQRRLMYFPPDKAGTPEQNGLSGFEVVSYTTEDDVELFGWASGGVQADNTKPVLLCFHGNASHVGSFGYKVLPYLHAGYGLFLAEYRGYAGNLGQPTEDGLIKDAKAAFATVRKAFPGRPVILFGESLGSGVAVGLAASGAQVKALILEAPFSSTLDVARHLYWYMPISQIMKDRFLSHQRLKSLDIPVLVIHGTEDKTVPYCFGKKLAASNPECTELVTIEGAGHNNLFDYAVYEHGLKWLTKNNI